MVDPSFISALQVFCVSKGFSPFNSNCRVIRTVKWFLFNTLKEKPLLSKTFYDLDMPQSVSRLEIDKLQVRFDKTDEGKNYITLVLSEETEHHFVITFEPFNVSF